jgi:hypothetical protein
MAFDRTAALAYVQPLYASLATLTGQLTTDTATGYGPAIDEAFMTYGVAYSDLATATAPDVDVPAVRALLRYFSLLGFEQRLSAKVDYDVVGQSAAVTKKQSAQLAQVRQSLAEAANQAAYYGFVVTASGGTFEFGRFNLDFLEPNGLAVL